MFITGIATTRFGKLTTSLPELMFQVLIEACADAGLEPRDIDAFYIANNLSQLTHGQSHLSAILAGYLPGLYRPIVCIEAACASGGVAVHQGCLALSRHKRVMVIGVEKMSEIPSKALLTMVASDADRVYDQAEGLIFPAAGGLVADAYLRKYNQSREALTAVARKNHDHGNLNPKAHFYGKTVTAEMIETSPLICSPLRLFDCSPNSDGAAAVILEHEARTTRAVQIAASSLVTNHLHFAGEKDPARRPELAQVAKQAYAESGLSAMDIQFAEFHDGFTVMELVIMENIGWCGPGEAGEIVRAGHTRLGGKRPVNPSGGLKACGHPLGATGVRQVGELVHQIRGEAGERQVSQNKVGMAVNIGSLIGSATAHVLKSCKL